MSAVCQGEGSEVTVIGALRVLLPSLLSAMRLMSSTFASMVCEPAVAVQVLEPLGPPLAVRRASRLGPGRLCCCPTN